MQINKEAGGAMLKPTTPTVQTEYSCLLICSEWAGYAV